MGIHARFGLQAEPDMSQYVMRNRLALLLEELGEHTAALNRDMEERAVKKLVDMLYVTLGTLELVDENLVGSALSAVADKNNAKTEETHRYHPDSGKLVRIVVDEE